jgi:hypothetical protein
LAGGGADDGEVGRLRQVGDPRRAGYPQDGLAHRADGIDDPAERAADEVDQDLAADALGVGGDADQGDPFRLEDLIEHLNGHWCFLGTGDALLSLIRAPF